jgi:hypothetical protein
MALALDAIENHGCDCGTDEPGTCLACRCEKALRTERARSEKAEDWKESALAVERLWDEQAVAKELKVGLGLTIRDKILPGIQALRARAEKAEEENRRLDGELFKWKP